MLCPPVLLVRVPAGASRGVMGAREPFAPNLLPSSHAEARAVSHRPDAVLPRAADGGSSPRRTAGQRRAALPATLVVVLRQESVPPTALRRPFGHLMWMLQSTRRRRCKPRCPPVNEAVDLVVDERREGPGNLVGAHARPNGLPCNVVVGCCGVGPVEPVPARVEPALAIQQRLVHERGLEPCILSSLLGVAVPERVRASPVRCTPAVRLIDLHFGMSNHVEGQSATRGAASWRRDLQRGVAEAKWPLGGLFISRKEE